MEKEISSNAKLEEVKRKNLQVWQEKEVVVTRTKIVRRLSFKNILSELFQLINLDRGLIFTVKGLTIRPAKTIRAYLDTDRDLITGPIKYFVIVLSLIFFVAIQTGYFDYNVDKVLNGDVYKKMEKVETKRKFIEKLEDGKIFYDQYVLPYQNIYTSGVILFMSILSFLIFRKSGFNFIENLAINTYIFSHTTLLVILIMLFDLKAIFWWRGYQLLGLAMTVWVYHRLFNQSLFKVFLKSLFIIAVSFLSYIIAIVMSISFYIEYFGSTS